MYLVSPARYQQKKKRYQQLGQREAVTTLNLDFSPVSIGSKQVPSLLSLPLAKNVPLLLCVQSAYASAVVYLSCFVIPPISESTHFVWEKILKCLF